MTNLAARGRAEASDFADRKVREVVVQQEAPLDLALFDVVYELLVVFCAERGGDERLRLAACEKSGAVNARQPTNLARDRSNLREAATIRAASVVQDVVAENRLFEMIENLFRHLSLLRLIFWIGFDDLFFERVNRSVTRALLLLRRIERGAQTLRVVALN